MHRWVFLASVLVIGLPCATVQAQTGTSYDPLRFVRWPVEDGKALVGRMASRDMLYVAGVGVSLFALQRYDQRVSDELTQIEKGNLIRAVEEVGNVKALRPLALTLFLGSLMTNNRRFQDAAFTSFEAMIYTNLLTSILKTVYGRSRPFQEQGPHRFRPFGGNTSFPSSHSSVAFAVVTPWVLYYPGLATAGLYLLSAGTAATRIITRFHWLTDVIGGSALGFTVAYFITRRHQDASQRAQIAPELGFNRIGIRVTF